MSRIQSHERVLKHFTVLTNRHVLFPKPLNCRLMILVIGSKSLQCRIKIIVCTSLSRLLSFPSPSNNSFKQNGIIAIQMQSQFRHSTQFHQIVCIFRRSRKAIEQYSFSRMTSHVSSNQRYNNCTRNESSLLHNVCALPTKRRVAFHLLTQQVSTTQVNDIALLLQSTTE